MIAPNWISLEPHWPTLGLKPDKNLAQEQITDVIFSGSRFKVMLEPKLARLELKLEPQWKQLRAKLGHHGAKCSYLGARARKEFGPRANHRCDLLWLSSLSHLGAQIS